MLDIVRNCRAHVLMLKPLGLEPAGPVRGRDQKELRVDVQLHSRRWHCLVQRNKMYPTRLSPMYPTRLNKMYPTRLNHKHRPLFSLTTQHLSSSCSLHRRNLLQHHLS